MIYEDSDSIDRFLPLLLTYFLCVSDGAAAMQAEALPLVNKFGLSETTDSPLRALLFPVLLVWI